ncbi:MAG: SPASM domain-containing protein [Prevotella sp.]|jgi:uncharacterized protein|nr:SPASM domain-containing protein [Prevotella sp.]
METKIYWSQFNHMFNSEKYGHILYNAETNAFANISIDLYNLLFAISKGVKEIEELDNATIDNLLQRKILVKDKNDYLYRRRLRYYFQAFDTSNLGLAVAPTTACNFICPYCYEDNKVNKYMTEEIEDLLLKFISGHRRTNILNLTWYGGEPLMGFKSIQRILDGLKRIDHIKLGLHNMPTNGYLLTKEVSLFFKENPMNSIQVTIDGAKEHHDNLRMLPGNLPTFDKIVSNLDTFMDYNPDTPVFIRMNLLNDNIDSYGKIHQELSSHWKGRDVLIYPAFVKDFSDSCKSNCNLVSREEKIEFFKELKDKYKIDVQFKPLNSSTGLCGATHVNYYVIGPEGEMYKCWNDLGVKEKIIGYIDGREKNYDVLTRYLAGPTIMDDKECQDCSIMPICTGGCLWVRHKNLYENKELDYMCCTRKDNLDKIIELQYEETLKASL